MKIVSKHPLLVGTVFLTFASAGLYGCKDFLTRNETPQGTLDATTLANQAGVEGSLIAAYRALDCTSVIQANWGCAASNWVWGNVAGGDTYKGSDITDQPPINDIEGYHWGTPDAETYLNEKGRVTSWTAKAYKGRVLVYAGQFAAAIPVLQDVMNNGPYKLETSFDHVWTGFKSFYNGTETIFAYQASANDGEPNGNNANYGERLNFPYSGSHFGCCGFNQPTQELVNFFKTDAATGLPLAITDPANYNASNTNLDWSQNTVPVDPRLDWTVGRDSVPYKDWGMYSIKGGWVRDSGNVGPYGPKKNAHEKASGAESTVGWQNTQLNSVHIHLF